MRKHNFGHAWRVRCQERARYYAWCAIRGHVPPGNDPETGQPLSSWREHDRQESRAAYAARARYWLGCARSMGEAMRHV